MADGAVRRAAEVVVVEVDAGCGHEGSSGRVVHVMQAMGCGATDAAPLATSMVSGDVGVITPLRNGYHENSSLRAVP